MTPDIEARARDLAATLTCGRTPEAVEHDANTIAAALTAAYERGKAEGLKRALSAAEISNDGWENPALDGHIMFLKQVIASLSRDPTETDTGA